MNILGKEIKKYRNTLNLSQLEFGELYDVDDSTVQRWERGTSRPPLDITNRIIERVRYEKYEKDTLEQAR